MRKLEFFKNAMILTVTALILRAIGIVFRIYMSNKIGPEGMGLYQLIFSIYVLAATFASSGISTAVTRLIAEEMGRGSKKSVLKILYRATALTLIIAVISSLAVFFGADLIARYGLRDVRAVPALQILAFSLPFMGVSSCLRGYFIARRNASSPSASQIFEQLVRIAVFMVLIDRFASRGLVFTCAVVLLADTVAEAVSCGYLWLAYRRDLRRLESGENRPRRPAYPVVRRIISIALPITAGRYLNTALHTAENLLVPGSLTKFNASRETSLSQFGMLKGMAMPILFFPASFLTAISTLLIPEISEAAAEGRKSKVDAAVKHSIHVTLTLSILISGLFMLLGPALGSLIYQSEEVGFMIRALAPIVPFMYLESVCDGILKGLNQQVSSFKYSVIDSVLRIALIVLLVPRQGMIGFLGVMTVSNILTSTLNIRRLLVVTKLKLDISKWIVKPVLAAAASGAAAFWLSRKLMLHVVPSLILSCAVVVFLFFVLLVLFRGVTREDFKFLKRSKKIQ